MVRIGATGHRLLTDHEKISAGIEAALIRIEELRPHSPLTILSSLAEGADILIATHALKRPGARLIVPLPLPPDDYLKDFVSPETGALFSDLLARADEVIQIPQSSSRDENYQLAGEFVLHNCDVLLAVWDGQLPQGKGGTGQVVALARELQLPLAWVRAGNRKPYTNEPTTLGAAQGRVEFERLENLINSGS